MTPPIDPAPSKAVSEEATLFAESIADWLHRALAYKTIPPTSSEIAVSVQAIIDRATSDLRAENERLKIELVCNDAEIDQGRPMLEAELSETKARLATSEKALEEARKALVDMSHCVDVLCTERNYADAVVACRNTQCDHQNAIAAARAEWGKGNAAPESEVNQQWKEGEEQSP